MEIRYVPLEDASEPWAPDTDDNVVIAEGPGNLQVIVSDEHCALYVVKDGELLREYAATSFSESDPPAVVSEVESFLEDEVGEDEEG